jgi:hypothetical protein
MKNRGTYSYAQMLVNRSIEAQTEGQKGMPDYVRIPDIAHREQMKPKEIKVSGVTIMPRAAASLLISSETARKDRQGRLPVAKSEATQRRSEQENIRIVREQAAREQKKGEGLEKKAEDKYELDESVRRKAEADEMRKRAELERRAAASERKRGAEIEHIRLSGLTSQQRADDKKLMKYAMDKQLRDKRDGIRFGYLQRIMDMQIKANRDVLRNKGKSIDANYYKNFRQHTLYKTRFASSIDDIWRRTKGPNGWEFGVKPLDKLPYRGPSFSPPIDAALRKLEGKLRGNRWIAVSMTQTPTTSDTVLDEVL